MTPRSSLGDLEQMVLLVILRLRDAAYAPDVARELEERAGRALSRGALYATLDRLEAKGLLEWEVEEESTGVGGHRRRRFGVTKAGVEEMARARETWARLFEGLDGTLRSADPDRRRA